MAEEKGSECVLLGDPPFMVEEDKYCELCRRRFHHSWWHVEHRLWIMLADNSCRFKDEIKSLGIDINNPNLLSTYEKRQLILKEQQE